MPDFNGDGKRDLAVTNASQQSVSVLMGNGDGSFGAAHSFATESVGYADTVVAGDVNGDGQVDLAVSNLATFGSVSILLGNGDGTFAAERTLATGSGPWYAAVADVNGDGKLDIVVADYGGNRISVLLGE